MHLYETDMWLSLPIISVMIRVIIGSSDVEDENRAQLKLENVSQIVMPDRNHIYDSNLLRSPPINPETMIGENNLEKIIRKRSAEELNTDLWNPLQKSEILSDDSLSYLPLHERSLRDSLLDSSQEKKSPAFNPWGGKRSEGYFNDKAYFLINKDNKSFLDKDSEKNFLEYAKRLPNFGRSGRRTPFHSWGGKRSTETEFKANRNIEVDVIPEDKINLYLSTDTLSDDAVENNISESIENEKRAARTSNSRLKVGFNSWGGKRSNVKDYRTTLSNESSFKDAIEKSISNADQLSIPEKRAAKGYTKKIYFHPWGGKQSVNTEVEIIPNTYAIRNVHPMKDSQVLFTWHG